MAGDDEGDEDGPGDEGAAEQVVVVLGVGLGLAGLGLGVGVGEGASAYRDSTFSIAVERPDSPFQ